MRSRQKMGTAQISSFPHTCLLSAVMLDEIIKRILFTAQRQRPRNFIVDQHPLNCRWAHVLLCHYALRGSEDPFLGFLHFTNIFTGVTGCDRACRYRQLCHLKTTTPQGHTRRLNISPPRKQNKKETVGSDWLSCGLINRRRTQS